MTSIHDLHQIAYDLGVELSQHDHGPTGWYSPKLQRISTRRGIAVWDYKSVLVHELCHVVNYDHFINHLEFNARHERRADDYAAELLINPQQIPDLAKWESQLNTSKLLHNPFGR